MQSWVRGTNSSLPSDIAVQWAQEVPEGFHARASALSRRYAYIVLQSPVRPSLEAGRVGWVYRPMHIEPMQEAAQCLLGEHDFTSFRASSCQALSPVKNIMHIGIQRIGQSEETAYWRFDFQASAFLHHMIRNLMGCFVAIGQGLQPPEWMRAVLQARSRKVAAPTFAPDGLYFLGPVYDSAWGLPERTAVYDSLPGISP
jgi:tRNA pseudouridine38-40 synthase